MFLTSSIISGFLRLGFLLLFLFYLNRRFINTSESNNFLEFLVHQWFKYGSIIGVMLFITIQLSIYDLLDCLIILMLIIAIDIIGVRNILDFKEYFRKASKKYMLQLLKFIDMEKTVVSFIALKKKETSQSNGYFIFFLILIVALAAFSSRFYLFKYDQYSLSGLWIADLAKVIDFDSQIWFLNDISIGGELAFTNFYSKIADVSPEIALQSTAILEAVLLSILMFWVIRKITTSKTIAPLFAAMAFAVGFVISPLNIYFILQHKPIFLALAFALPAMVFLLRPTLLKFKQLNYFFSMLLVFITIGLIDLFTLLILLPPFVLLAGIFTKSKSRRLYWIGFAGFLSALLITLGIYGVICFYFDMDLVMFIHSSLVSVSSYTYIPQLIMPLDMLLNYTQFGSWIAMLLILKYVFYDKENWGGAFAFLTYFNLLVFMRRIDSSWIDPDVLNTAFCIFIPLIAGICAAAIIRIFVPIFERFEHINRIVVVCCLAGMIYLSYYYQKGTVTKLTVSNDTSHEVLEAYDRIGVTYFPYSYAVVNSNMAQTISTNQHYFVSYSDFLHDYLKQDSIYFANIKNEKFFKKNPDAVIPKSVLIFTYKKDALSMYGEDGDISPGIFQQMNVLKKRGRAIGTFYESADIKVYEIINEPGESKTRDLIF